MTGRLDWRSGGAVIQMSIARLACTACGAEANASCNCGKPYIPAPRERAKEAIKATPQKSNVVIADEIEVSPETVRRARQDLTSSGVEVDGPRIGRDGKTRQLPAPKKIEDNDYDPDDDRKRKEKQESVDINRALTKVPNEFDPTNIPDDEFAGYQFLFVASDILESGTYTIEHLSKHRVHDAMLVEALKVTEQVIEQWSGIRSLLLNWSNVS
jgi:hypothetical protein